MMKIGIITGLFSIAILVSASFAAEPSHFQHDLIDTSAGPLEINFIGHASLFFNFQGKVIQVDPDGSLADFSTIPKADLVLITHEHKDHCDPGTISKLVKESSTIVSNAGCAEQIKDKKVEIMKNGDVRTIDGIRIEAVPAYNLVHMRSPGMPYHPKGTGNGYVLTFGDRRVYIAGDTEDIPEMKELKDIDVAFLPMNLPYTMTPEMTAAAALSFRPKILYPYHQGDTDTSRIVSLLKDSGIDVRIRIMK